MKKRAQKTRLKLYGPFILVLLVVISWSAFFYFVSPTTVVQKIGIQNSYLVVFILAVICGFSSFTTTTFYVTVVALSHGGVDPLALGLVGGVGLCISDLAFYYFVSRGTPVIDHHWEWFSSLVKRFVAWMPDWFLYPFILVYSALAPVPNDILLVTLAVGGIRFKRIAPFLFAGDVISVILLAHISQ